MAGQVWGVLVLECQGMGIVITALTGWPLQNSIIVGAIIGILWVVFAGMKELGAVNVVNATVMYIGLIIATVAVAFKMPGGNFNFIMDTFTGEESFMTNVFGNANLFISFAVGQIIAVTFVRSISQAADADDDECEGRENDPSFGMAGSSIKWFIRCVCGHSWSGSTCDSGICGSMSKRSSYDNVG
ncbi:MAG: hypothetical protein ACLUD0_06080 [Eubacterium ramulus]